MLCNTAIDAAIQKKDGGPSTSCGKATCKATKIGIIVMGLQAAGLYPLPESAQTMYRSVVWYWKALKSIGAEFKFYNPCDGTLGHGKGNHYSSCSFEKCLGDFGLLTRAEATLKQYGHRDILTHLLSVSWVPFAALTMLIRSEQVHAGTGLSSSFMSLLPPSL